MRPKDLDLISDFGVRRPGLLPWLIWKLATHRMIGSARRRAIRKSLASRFPGPFDIQADDIVMRAYPMENYCDRIAIGRGHLPEKPERDLIEPLLKPGMLFVDIGANVGTYSLFVARRCGDNARILSFEPHPRTYAKLAFNIEANGFSCIEAVNAGIGPDYGRLQLHSAGGNNIGTASILPEAVSAKQHVDIKVVPLVDALKTRLMDHVDLLKIDIEGFEDQALMPLLVERHKALWPRAVLLETLHKKHWQTDCVGRFKDLGYTIAADTGENLLLLHPVKSKPESGSGAEADRIADDRAAG